MSASIVVTGANGFLGGVISVGAQAAGHRVVRLGRADRGAGPDRIEGVPFEAVDLAKVLVREQPDVVVHAVGRASVAKSIEDPAGDHHATVGTWATMLEAVRLAGVDPTVVLLSSAAVYGDPVALPVAEDAELAPISPYGRNKAECEQVAERFAADHGVRSVVARLFSVMGPEQRRLLLWDLAVQALGAAPAITVHGSGLESRDYLDADDAAAIVVALALAPGHTGVTTCNVASGTETSIADVARMVAQLSGTGKAVEFLGEPRPGDPLRWRADVTRLAGFVGDWAPRPVDEVVARCLDAWRALPADELQAHG